MSVTVEALRDGGRVFLGPWWSAEGRVGCWAAPASPVTAEGFGPCPCVGSGEALGLTERLGGDRVEATVAEFAEIVAERLQGPFTLGVTQSS